jgi:peptidoglycan hydrolase CwlO-like protein
MNRPHNLRAPVRRLLALIALGALTVGVPASASPSSGQLESQISSSNARDGELSAAISADSHEIEGFQGSIDDLQTRLNALESSLGIERNLLLSLKSQLKSARSHLTQLKAQLITDKRVLVAQVIASYESPPPDIVTVILESHGFADMIERVEDLRSISRENAKATTDTKTEQQAVTAQTERLTTLEASQQSETAAVRVQRDEVAQLHLALVDHQLQYIDARDTKSSELGTLRAHRGELEHELAKLAVSELASRGVAYAYTGPVGNYTSTPQGEYGFFQAPGTDYSVGEEPILVAHLNTLGIALHLHLIGISGYRTPEHSIEVGGFADDPHTRGEASDTPGIEGVPQATLARFGLIRPFPSPAEADHIQLLGSRY